MLERALQTFATLRHHNAFIGVKIEKKGCPHIVGQPFKGFILWHHTRAMPSSYQAIRAEDQQQREPYQPRC
ncbi:MAG: hypothetical protein U0I89_06165, partial [Prevotella sp.]|nr:hypothetical protein [Prevotella sp.]